MSNIINESNEVSFNNLRDKMREYTPRFGDSISLCFSIDHWDYSHAINESSLTYRASFVSSNSCLIFESKSPYNLIEQIDVYLNNQVLEVEDIII